MIRPLREGEAQMPEQERPTRPNLENLRKQAKSLHKQFRSHDAESVEREFARAYPA
jgi:hypothetical protein